MKVGDLVSKPEYENVRYVGPLKYGIVYASPAPNSPQWIAGVFWFSSGKKKHEYNHDLEVISEAR